MNQKDLLILSVTVFLTVLAWVVLDLYGIKKDTPTQVEVESVKLEYTINTELLELLDQRTP